MGAWGYGPFDSDQALDFLAGLAGDYATIGDDDEIAAGSVDHDGVVAAAHKALAAASGPLPAGDYDLAAGAYAVAGLVAAARDAAVPAQSGGTRLFEAIAGGGGGLGLEAHCGYRALLRPQDAETLLEDARVAVDALASTTWWVQDWKADISPTLANLAAALT